MVAASSRCAQSLIAAAIVLIALSTSTQARHWHHHGHIRSSSQEPGKDPKPESAGRTSGLAQSGGEPSGFGGAVERMIRTCDQQIAELKRMPLDAVVRTIQPSDAQRDALEQIRVAANEAAETLVNSCPKQIQQGLSARFDQLGRTVAAMMASLATLRPSFASFYALLNDEQKAQLVARMFSDDAQAKSSHRLVDSARAVDDPALGGQDVWCLQWISTLRSWPTRQIETALTLSDDQRAALYQVTAAMYRAVGALVARCPAENPLTPVSRLDSEENRMQALREGLDAIEPAFADFEEALNGDEKARLDEVLNTSRAPEAVVQ